MQQKSKISFAKKQNQKLEAGSKSWKFQINFFVSSFYYFPINILKHKTKIDLARC